jgi:protein gp37
VPMAQVSSIEWTDATWNPVTGCTKVSQGCKHCYAERWAERFRGVRGHAFEQGFDLKLWPDRVELPLRWKASKRIFVNSMSDLFHERIPLEFIQKIFETMRKAHWHRFQILTKRSGRLALLGNSIDWPGNVWMGVSVEDARVLHRIRDLRSVPAEIRFLSLEPLIGPLPDLDLEGIHWVIVGGESGPGARPMRAHWVREIRAQCRRQSVPFFFKQWGGVHKGKAGRVLDRRTYDEFPEPRTAAAPSAIA